MYVDLNPIMNGREADIDRPTQGDNKINKTRKKNNNNLTIIHSIQVNYIPILSRENSHIGTL